jgi:hypothetical protein
MQDNEVYIGQSASAASMAPISTIPASYINRPHDTRPGMAAGAATPGPQPGAAHPHPCMVRDLGSVPVAPPRKFEDPGAPVVVDTGPAPPKGRAGRRKVCAVLYVHLSLLDVLHQVL